MRKFIRLVEALHGEIIPPDHDPQKRIFGGGEFSTDDPKHDRSWENESDAPLMPVYEFGEQVSHDEFVAFLKRNADRLRTSSYGGGPDGIGVSDSRQSWTDAKRIERAFYTSGYQDTEYWIDPQWGKGIDGTLSPNELAGPTRMLPPPVE